jgi:hypothetical protein
MYEKKKYDADWFLFDVVKGNMWSNGEGISKVNYGGDVVDLKPVYYRKLNMTAMYLNRHYNLSTMGRSARIGLARIQYGYSITYFGCYGDLSVLGGAFSIVKSRTDYSSTHDTTLLNKVLSGKINLGYTAISANHLRHIALPELLNILKEKPFRKNLDRLTIMSKLLAGSVGKDMHEAAFVGISIWLLTISQELYNYVRVSRLFNVVLTLKEWQAEAKDLSLRLKSLQNIVAINLTQCFELDVLVNRGVGAVNWQKEQKNRTTELNVTTHSYKEIFEETVAMFSLSKAQGKKPSRVGWHSFWAKRWEWAPTGSFHSQYDVDNVHKPKEREIRNKLYMLCKEKDHEFSYYYQRPPQTIAWPSTKYEWGKMRAIYGVDVTNFIMTCYGFINAERCMPSDCPLGDSANEENVTRLVTQTLNGTLPYCLDFDDFNSQHSTESMQAALDGYLAVYASDIDPEQRMAIEWSRDALNDCQVYPNSSCPAYTLRGTLFSGWRLTSLVNTILNRAYVQIAKRGRLLATNHSGDDVLVGLKTLDDMLRINKGLVSKNARLQDSKCFLGGIGEFLRVDRRQKNMSQYLARSISTLVHGPTESIIPNDLTAILEANNTRCKEYCQRGGTDEMADIILRVVNKRTADLWSVPMDMLINYMGTHRAAGGGSDDMKSSTDTRYRLVNLNQACDNNNATGEFPGAYAHAKYLCTIIFEERDLPKIYKKLKASITSSLASNRWSIEVDPAGHGVVWWNLVKQKYKSLRQVSGYGKARIAKMFGLPMTGLRAGTSEVYKTLKQYDNMHFWASKLL